MSYIASLEGKVVYNSSKGFEEAVKRLDEHESFKRMVKLNYDQNEITIPTGTYRNLGRNLQLLLDSASDGYIVGVSNDAKWHGFVATPQTEDEFDLENWAAESGFKESRPLKENFDTEDDWWNEYVNWQSDVRATFMQEKSQYLV